MNYETLDRANKMRNKIEKLKGELDSLGRPAAVVRVYYMSGKGETLFSTIGTGDNCEHPDADLALSFHKQLTLRRQAELEEAEREFLTL
jgi:hypothetical protein